MDFCWGFIFDNFKNRSVCRFFPYWFILTKSERRFYLQSFINQKHIHFRNSKWLWVHFQSFHLWCRHNRLIKWLRFKTSLIEFQPSNRYSRDQWTNRLSLIFKKPQNKLHYLQKSSIVYYKWKHKKLRLYFHISVCFREK